jgi:hypothetical protein
MEQQDRLLAALRTQPLTTLEIINRLGIIRPAAVVHRLRAKYLTIETEIIEVKNRWGEICHVAKYRLFEGGQVKPKEKMVIPKDGWKPVEWDTEKRTTAAEAQEFANRHLLGAWPLDPVSTKDLMNLPPERFDKWLNGDWNEDQDEAAPEAHPDQLKLL